MLKILIIIAIAALFMVVIFQPYKKQKFDQTVKQVRKRNIIISAVLSGLYWSTLGVMLYISHKIVNAYNILGNELENNINLDKLASNVILSKDTADLITTPFVLFCLIIIAMFGVIAYVGYLTLTTLIIQIIAYKQHNKDPYLKNLITSLKQAKRSDYSSAYFNSVSQAYFEMKESHSKGKLYINQWNEVVKILLLVGETKEAEKLNSYIFERSKYCKMLDATFTESLALNSVYKISLYDYKQLDKDKARVNKIENKHNKSRKKVNN
ncbi:hypothetical protein [Staphylococcus saprophyticus]|uniref:hypothetical protein n=1 Tax=Staphylococcus saprophyticus TaxID=29385 RepID=UPI0034C69CBF